MLNTSAIGINGLSARKGLRNFFATTTCGTLKRRLLELQLAMQSETANCKESRAKFVVTLNRKVTIRTTPNRWMLCGSAARITWSSTAKNHTFLLTRRRAVNKARFNYRRELVWAAELSAAYIIGKGKHMNDADFDLLDRVPSLEARLRALQAELERAVIDNHFLREENEVLRRNFNKPETLR
jgi:hypothetical protein